MSESAHREAMSAPLYRADMSPTLDDSAMGYLPREQARESDEAADKPIAEPWDEWMLVHAAVGALALGLAAILANFVYDNWHVVSGLARDAAAFFFR
jgi:hypothetical protein